MGTTRALKPVSRFLAFLPNSEAGASRLYVLGERARRRGLDVAVESGYLLAVDRQVDDRASETTELVDTFAGSRLSMETTGAGHPRIGNILRVRRGHFSLRSDPLALKPYYIASRPDGDVLASRLDDLLGVFPETGIAIDPRGVAALLTFGHPLGEHTTLSGISRPRAGTEWTWSEESGLRRQATPALEVAVDGLSSLRANCQRLHELLTQAMRRALDGADQNALMGVSGGFDSRLLALLARDAGVGFTAFTYGMPWHREVRMARRFIQAYGLDAAHAPYVDDLLMDRVGSHLGAVEAQADLSVLQITQLMAGAPSDGVPVIHGLFGDSLNGAHLTPLPDEITSPEELAARLVARRTGEDALVEALSREMGVGRDELVEDVLADLRTDCPLYQALMQWDLTVRQRRFPGAHLALLGERLAPIVPLYDEDLFRFWLSRPRALLDERMLFRRYLHDYHPAAARIPHAEEAQPIASSLREQMRVFAADRWHSRIARLRGRSQNIWSMSHRQTPWQRRQMQEALDARRSLLADCGLPFDGLINDVGAARRGLRNMFLLGEHLAALHGERKAHERG